MTNNLYACDGKCECVYIFRVQLSLYIANFKFEVWQLFGLLGLMSWMIPIYIYVCVCEFQWNLKLQIEWMRQMQWDKNQQIFGSTSVENYVTMKEAIEWGQKQQQQYAQIHRDTGLYRDSQQSTIDSELSTSHTKTDSYFTHIHQMRCNNLFFCFFFVLASLFS